MACCLVGAKPLSEQMMEFFFFFFLLLEPTAVFCFVLSWRHNNVTLGIGTVWRMTSFAVVQSPVAVKDRVLTPFLVNDGILLIGPVGTNFGEILIEIITFIHENAFERVVCETADI